MATITNDEIKQLESLVNKLKNQYDPLTGKEIITTTVDYCGAELEVGYHYYKGSDPVWYYSDGSGHPGDPDEIDIVSITGELTHVLDLLDKKESASKLIEDFYNDIEIKILEQHENY